LLIDNADGSREDLAFDKSIPQSQYGTVILTSTSHRLKKLCHFALKLGGIEENVSDVLLLTSAAQPQPVTLTTLHMARDTCQKIGSLPLAILQAGAAISTGVCTLENCMEMFEKPLPKAKSTAGIKAESTPFEMLNTAGSQDALQILQVLSFMQSQQFDLQIFMAAVHNPQRQINTDEESMGARPGSSSTFSSWNLSPLEIARGLYGSLQRQGEFPALPRILHALRDADPEEARDQFRAIFGELRDLALIDRNEENGMYSMHSSISWWIRASMTFQEKQVHCEAACNVLGLAILLPPLGTGYDDVRLRRQCLPHIQYAKQQQEQLARMFKKRQHERGKSWLNIKPTLDRAQLLRDSKFSFVYAETGMFRESHDLMKKVDSYLSRTTGLDDPIAVTVRLFLAETSMWLGDPGEARQLQEELRDACAKGLGEEHVDTLRVSERLGASYCQLGKYYDGRKFAEKAVKGYRKMYPSDHVEKSQALTTLGCCFEHLADFDRAIVLHEEALLGLEMAEQEAKIEYGDQVMNVKENLAMARHARHRYKYTGKDELSEAERLQGEVSMHYREKLGKEHPKTLWATCKMARIKASAGMLEEAEQTIKASLSVMERTMGVDHIEGMRGKTSLGQILMEAGKLEEAESLLSTVMDTYRARYGKEMYHGHLITAASLLDCRRRMKRYREAESLERRVLGGIRRVFGRDSLWEHYLAGRNMVGTGVEMLEETREY
jgi:hypothetical protein